MHVRNTREYENEITEIERHYRNEMWRSGERDGGEALTCAGDGGTVTVEICV